jgi:hypothetical protein
MFLGIKGKAALKAGGMVLSQCFFRLPIRVPAAGCDQQRRESGEKIY